MSCQREREELLAASFLPSRSRRNILITSALPYVNNIPHLGNIIGSVLSSDVFARYCRQRKYQTLFVCGTDEYGTATETKAIEEKTTPQAICDKYYRQHREIYAWFQVQFDFFGRTTTSHQTQIVQDIFSDVEKNDFIFERKGQQLYCERDQRFLADRFVEGKCPLCEYVGARGDQCDQCGKLLNPTDLIDPECQICRQRPVLRDTTHLYLELPKLESEVAAWFRAKCAPGCSNNAITITESWLREGLKSRAITRDLKWGTPVPRKGYEDKVFYVWFDAPVGYMSISASYLNEGWKKWWMKEEPKSATEQHKSKEPLVELVQFMGKDNVPFHSIVFPCSLLATKRPWNLVARISATEYLTYEKDKFSKSRGVGVFGNQVYELDLPVDIWRYYLLSIRPEMSDTDFLWSDLQSKINSDLADNLGNLVFRALNLVSTFFDSKIPALCVSAGLERDDVNWMGQVQKELEEYLKHMEAISIRSALRTVLAFGRLGNEYFQKFKPWFLVKRNKSRCATVVYLTCSLLKLLAVCMHPFLPALSLNLLHQLGEYNAEQLEVRLKRTFEYLSPGSPKPSIPYNEYYDEALMIPGHFYIGYLPFDQPINSFSPLVKKISDSQLAEYRHKFCGSQANLSPSDSFELDLRIGVVQTAAPHPGSAQHVLLQIDLGDGVKQAVAALAQHYSLSELTGQRVAVVCNMEPNVIKKEWAQVLVLTMIKSGRLALVHPDRDAPAGTRIYPQGGRAASAYKMQTAKQVKGMPFKYQKDGIVYKKDALVGSENMDNQVCTPPVRLVVSKSGDWQGGLIQ
ncbi:probable methionine--tRNA ligase, cytoplasmic isoform X2 [Schistocerca gregaria]|nr:probable methionine--tRNA ligase, cytoplasmic isoform X2 [Schistocerca gregaria]